MPLRNLLSFDFTWIITALMALVTYLFVSQCLRRRGLPPGPRPFPIIGNLLALSKKDIIIDELFDVWRKKYGDIFTIWLGPSPVIVVCEWETIRDGLLVQRNTFAGRIQRVSGRVFLGGHSDVLFTDFNPTWEVLRKLLLSAVRKYANSEKLPKLIEDVLDETLNEMFKEKGPVDIDLCMYLSISNIIATTAFGQRYAIDDKEFLHLKKTTELINNEFPARLPADVFPFLRCIFYHRERRLAKLATAFRDVIAAKYEEHKKTYVSGVIRDFTDAVLAAKEAAEEEDSKTAVHLTDDNLICLIMDLFNGGTDTTRSTINWMLLYISNFPEVQEKIRQEIANNIGDRMPVQEDRYKCPYTVAALTEVLRVRPIIRFTLEHKAMCDAQLGGYNIPKNTSLLFNIKSQHSDSNLWPDPETFKPERFLDENGKLTSERLDGYLPFGLGRRGCPGEKLAKADLFLVLTRMLQFVRFSLPNGPGSADLQPNNELIFNRAKEMNILVEKIPTNPPFRLNSSA